MSTHVRHTHSSTRIKSRDIVAALNGLQVDYFIETRDNCLRIYDIHFMTDCWQQSR